LFLYKQIYLKERLEVRNSLQSIFGVGWYKSLLVTSRIGLSYPFSSDNVNVYISLLFCCVLDGVTWLESRIRRMVSLNIKKLIEIESYRGFRHRDKLPCRGQRTRTNAKSVKRLII
jgi:small subunit ribosomal protein S13